MRISDWSSDVCSSDLVDEPLADAIAEFGRKLFERLALDQLVQHLVEPARFDEGGHGQRRLVLAFLVIGKANAGAQFAEADFAAAAARDIGAADAAETARPEEHKSEIQ